MRNLYEDCKGYVFAWFISPPSLNLCTPQTLQMRSRFSRLVSSNYRSRDGKIKALARTCGSSLTTHGNRWSGEDFLVDHGWPHMTSQCDMTDMTSPDSWRCRLCRLCHSNISLCIDYGWLWHRLHRLASNNHYKKKQKKTAGIDVWNVWHLSGATSTALESPTLATTRLSRCR